MKTEDLVAALRCSATPPIGSVRCFACEFGKNELIDGGDYVGCDCDRIAMDAATKIEELIDRCARYAEEIAVLREEVKL